MHDPRRVAILISGRGSNMRALIEQARTYEVVLVASNRPDAPGLGWAGERGLATWALDSRAMERERFDKELSGALEDHHTGTIALAGFMRILSPWFIDRWRGRIINIHPSLLPKYRGLHTHARALDAGENASGCSVHIVTQELDAGEILAQSEVPIQSGDTPDTLEERVLAAEHQLYPEVLNRFVTR